jgi:hypothetical protein
MRGRLAGRRESFRSVTRVEPLAHFWLWSRGMRNTGLFVRCASILAASALLGACAGDIINPEGTRDDSRALSLILEGAELGDELTRSPVREAPMPFVRLGLMWDAELSTDIEIATSADGQTWSAWRAVTVLGVEHEGPSEIDAAEADGESAARTDRTSMIGTYEVEGPAEALYYRLRGASDSLPHFMVVDFLELTLSESLEDGKAYVDEGIGTLAQALSVGGTAVNPRSSWGAVAPRCVSNHTPNRITIHHTVTPTSDSMSPQARLRNIQNYHRNVLGWCDIGYNFLVSRDGRLWEGRGAARLGTHVANNNTGNVGISFMGTHTSTQATSTQLDRVAALVRGLRTQYGIATNSSRIKGHRDYNSTACPGNALYGQIGTIINRANNAGGGGGGGTTPPPGGTTVKGIIYRGNDTSARISGATVRLGTRTATSSATGYFEFSGVSAGNHTVTASRSGFETRSVTRAVSGAETWASMGLSPAAAGTGVLVGVIYKGNDSSNRIPGATVTLSNGRSTTADGNGYYRLEGLAPGTYTITAAKAGHPTRSVSRQVQNNTTTWGSISL